MNDQENLPANGKRRFFGRKEKGFTTIELMIVLVTIGILAAIAIPQFRAYRSQTYDAQAQVDAKNFYKACVNAAVDASGLVVYWSGSLPPAYTGMAPDSGWFVYSPHWGTVVFCNASFHHPEGKRIYTLDDQGDITWW